VQSYGGLLPADAFDPERVLHPRHTRSHDLAVWIVVPMGGEQLRAEARRTSLALQNFAHARFQWVQHHRVHGYRQTGRQTDLRKDML
jgi:hypothetical protein